MSDSVLNPQQEAFLKKLKKYSDLSLHRKHKYLYVVQTGDYFKIGVASDMDSRLTTLQVGSPFDIKIRFADRHRNAKELERALKDYYTNKGKHLRGEWFKLEETDLDGIVDIVQSYE